jgi:hypothetical protein
VLCSIVDWGTVLQAGRSQVRDLIMPLNFISLPDPFGRTRPQGFLSVLTELSIRNRKIARPVSGADNLTAISEWLSRKCGILNISQPYRPSRSVMWIVFFLTLFLDCILILIVYLSLSITVRFSYEGDIEGTVCIEMGRPWCCVYSHFCRQMNKILPCCTRKEWLLHICCECIGWKKRFYLEPAL